MGLKVVVFGKDACTHQFFLKNSDEVKEVLGGVVTDIVHLVGRNGKTVLAVLFLWGMLHDADDSLYNVIDKGEVAHAVAVIEDLDGLAFDQFVSKTKVGHVGTTCRTIDSEEAEAR